MRRIVRALAILSVAIGILAIVGFKRQDGKVEQESSVRSERESVAVAGLEGGILRKDRVRLAVPLAGLADAERPARKGTDQNGQPHFGRLERLEREQYVAAWGLDSSVVKAWEAAIEEGGRLRLNAVERFRKGEIGRGDRVQEFRAAETRARELQRDVIGESRLAEYETSYRFHGERDEEEDSWSTNRGGAPSAAEGLPTSDDSGRGPPTRRDRLVEAR